MPQQIPLINNFNSGELSPLLDGRTDLKKYFSGCRTLKNFLVTPYGGAVRRPGTYFVAETKDSSKKSRLIPFEYNVEQAYTLEVGDQYIRFCKNGGQIVYSEIDFEANPTGDFVAGAIMTGGTSGATAIVVAKVSTQVYTIKYVQGTFVTETISSGAETVAASSPTVIASSTPAEISSPYLEADLFDLHFLQSADVLYIVDNEGGYQPRKLSRLSHDYWTLEAIDFDYGPFLDDNDTAVTINPPSLPTDVTTDEDTLTASTERAGYPVEEAFDNISGNGNGWSSTDGNVTDQWIQIDFDAGDTKTIKRIRIQPKAQDTGSNRVLRHFKLQGSNEVAPNAGEDHEDWTKLSANKYNAFCSAYDTDEVECDKITNYTDWVDVEFNNSTAYRHYRIWIYDNYGAPSYVTVGEIEMFETVGNEYSASDEIWTSDHVGSIWKLAHQKTDNAQQDTCDAVGEIGTAIRLKNTCRFRTTADGQSADKYVIKRKYDDDPDYHYFKTLRGGLNYDISWQEPNKDGADYIVELLAETADDDVEFTLSCEQNYDVSIIRILTVVDSQNVTAILLNDVDPGNVTTKLWAEGAWSDARGWPRTIGFFEGRIVYAGNTYNPLTLWLSETNKFEGMRAKTLAEEENFDDDALIFTISAAQQNMIKWIMGQDALLIGTAGSEGKLSSYNRTQPLTPGNIPEYRPQSSYGSGNIQPLLINDVIVFAQRENKKLREFKYSFNDDIFVARDLTLYSEHITASGITQIAHQKQPDSILWGVRDEGTLLGMGYERLEDIYGWFRVVTDGSFESVAVISAAGQTTVEDEIWTIVNRTIGESTVRMIEYFKPRNWGDTDTDVFFVDSGLSAAGSGGNTYIGGLDHLEGKTVDILSDGKVCDQQVVGTGKTSTTGYVDLKIGGVATISTTKIHIGLNFESELQPMKLEVPMGQFGTSRGRKKRIHEAVISFFKTLGGFYGRDSSNLDELDHAVIGTSGSMTSLKTQEETVSFPGTDDTDGNIIIKQTYPLPMTVRAVMPKLDVTEM